MKTYKVTLLLLLFEVNLNFGHTLSKRELRNETEIYEIKEDQSALLITHPKDEATKLREIIYYHIIERPYNAKDSHDKIEPDFEKRLFTNSHSGIQFAKKDSNDDEDDSTSEELDDSSQESDWDSNSSESNEDNDSEQSSDKSDLSKDETNDEDKSSSKRHGDKDSIKENDKSDADDNKKSPIDPDSIKIDIRFSDFINNKEAGVAKVESTTANVTADPETEIEAISETPQSRSKRGINQTVTGKEKSKETKERINYADDKTLKREVGTYGMSLTGNKGVVWNDVKPTHFEYYVGEQEPLATSRPEVLEAEDLTTTESAKEPVVIQEINEDNQGDDDDDDDDEEEFIDTFAELEQIFDKLTDKMDKTGKSESKQENQKDGDSANIRNINNDNDDDNDNSSLDPKEIEKTFIEILKVYKELTGDDTRTPAVLDAVDSDISEEKKSEESSNGHFLRALKDDEDVANNIPVKLDAKLAPKKNDKDKETNNKGNDIKQQQFVKELLKNKYFWAWLKDASAAYLEIFKKKFDAAIKTEVGNQIEQYFKEHKSENCKEDKQDQIDVVQEPVQTSNVTDANVEGSTSSTVHNGLASNNTTAESITESNDTSSETSTKKHKDKPSDDKNADTPVKIEAQNLFGSSVGSGKVTNIFIYNINKAFALEDIKPIKNSSDGVFVFGLGDKIPEQENGNTSNKIPEKIPEVETVKPGISLEPNKTVDQVIETDVNQSSEKDKDQVKNEDNVENSTDKSEVIPNNQTITEASNDEKTSTEISKEESASKTQKPVEEIKVDKEKDAKTEKVEPKEDPNDTVSDKTLKTEVA